MSIIDFEKKAAFLRRIIFKTICNGGGGHIPTAFSIVEILTVLYYDILNIHPQNPSDPHRDRFILSKGHAAVALYAVLADRGYFEEQLLSTYGKRGTFLGGHPDIDKMLGVEASTGALGHGFPFGVGIALAGKLDQKKYRVFVVVGDGECQEGTIWEAALFASQHQLSNLTVIIDYNKLQAMDKLNEIVSLEPLCDKWKSFGWAVKEVNGHDSRSLRTLLHSVPFDSKKPNLIIAHTVKGRGISYMENTPIWHYRFPKGEEMDIACRELGIKCGDGKML